MCKPVLQAKQLVSHVQTNKPLLFPPPPTPTTVPNIFFTGSIQIARMANT